MTNDGVSIRYSEMLVLVAHHASRAADIAMRYPHSDPTNTPEFNDHIHRAEQLTAHLASVVPKEEDEW